MKFLKFIHKMDINVLNVYIMVSCWSSYKKNYLIYSFYISEFNFFSLYKPSIIICIIYTKLIFHKKKNNLNNYNYINSIWRNSIGRKGFISYC